MLNDTKNQSLLKHNVEAYNQNRLLDCSVHLINNLYSIIEICNLSKPVTTRIF